jgi:hypothetical protein
MRNGSSASTTTAATAPVAAYSGRGSSTQNSLPSGSPMTTHGTLRWPMSTREAPSDNACVTCAAWWSGAALATSRCTRFFTVGLGSVAGTKIRSKSQPSSGGAVTPTSPASA